MNRWMVARRGSICRAGLILLQSLVVSPGHDEETSQLKVRSYRPGGQNSAVFISVRASGKRPCWVRRTDTHGGRGRNEAEWRWPA